MSGVVDERGQQWEHCGVCGEFVRIEELRYEFATEAQVDAMVAALRERIAAKDWAAPGAGTPESWQGYLDEMPERLRRDRIDVGPCCAPDAPAVGPALVVEFR